MIKIKQYLLLASIILSCNTMLVSQDRLSEDDAKIQKVYIAAMGEKMVENYESAAKLFKKVLDKDKKNHAAAYELARLYITLKDEEKALDFARKANQLDPENQWYGVLLADLLEKQGEYKEITKLYDKLIKAHPRNTDFYYEQAYMYIRLEKLDEAMAIYKKLEDLEGIGEDVIMMQHKIYLKKGENEKAIAELKRLVEAFPNTLKYQHILADLYNQLGQGDKAKAIYETILKDYPNDANALVALADVYKQKGQDVEYLTALSSVFADPNIQIDAKVKELFPYIRKISGSKNKSLVDVSVQSAKLITEAHEDEAKAFSLYGDMQYHAGQLEGALSAYKSTLKLDKSVFAVWEQTMFVLADLQKYKELEKTSEDAMDLFPNQALAYYMNGVAYNQQGKYEAAIEAYEPALMMAGRNKALKSQIYSQLGSIYNTTKKYKKSDANFEKALELNPQDYLTLNNYSYYLSVRGEKLDKAKEMSALSNELMPNTASFQDTYAWILFKKGEYKDAKVWLEKAMKNGAENDPEVLEHYGDVLYKLNDIEQAVANWQKAKSNGSKSKNLNQKISSRKIVK